MKMADVLKLLMERTIINGKPITQGRLAEETGVPQPTIHRALSGKHTSMNLENLIAIANYFGVTLGQLAGTEELDKKEWSPEAKAVAQIVDSMDAEGRRAIQDRAEKEKFWRDHHMNEGQELRKAS
jgi:transcriptional regulator with XRE-family HTH domain